MNHKTPSVCAICGSRLVSKEIEYIEKINGHFLIIENVPVRECLDNGHQFFHASVAKEIERLFELDRQQALKPKKMVTVPVVGLAMAMA